MKVGDKIRLIADIDSFKALGAERGHVFELTELPQDGGTILTMKRPDGMYFRAYTYEVELAEAAPQPAPSGGLKYDSDKPRMELLSHHFIEGISTVLGFGAKKYGEHNWRKGISQSRLIGASLRHTFAFLRGEDKDPESGLSHLYHAGCCLMFAAETLHTRPDLDDRYKGEKK